MSSRNNKELPEFHLIQKCLIMVFRLEQIPFNLEEKIPDYDKNRLTAWLYGNSFSLMALLVFHLDRDDLIDEYTKKLEQSYKEAVGYIGENPDYPFAYYTKEYMEKIKDGHK